MCAKDYRLRAKQSLEGNWGVMILSMVVYAVLMGALAYTAVGSILATGILAFGLATVSLSIYRGRGARLEMLFEGLKCDFASQIVAGILYTVFLALWSLLLWIPGIIKSYSYAMTFYILRDNEGMSGNDAITRSREMMDGHKWELFCLHVSFIGWILLSMLTFGILLIYVAPYMKMANTAFYENLKQQQEAFRPLETEPPVNDNIFGF